MILFDLDSTLVDVRGCTGLLGDWEAYGEAIAACPPYEPMVAFADELDSSGVPFAVVSGRSESHRPALQEWLAEQGLMPDAIYLRPALNTDREPELFWRTACLIELPSIIITGREAVAEHFRARGVQSLLVTPLIQEQYTADGELTAPGWAK